jgi:adenylate cyclase 8
VLITLGIFLNLFLGLVSWWRCYANNYLHWGALATWLLLFVQGCGVYSIVGRDLKEHMYVDAMVWYFIFIIFVMYCIMPMPFKWCITTCIITSLTHIFCISVVTLTDMSNQPISYSSVSSLLVILNSTKDNPEKPQC